LVKSRFLVIPRHKQCLEGDVALLDNLATPFERGASEVLHSASVDSQFWVANIGVRHHLKSGRGQEIVCVDPTKESPPSPVESLPQRVCLSAIPLTHPASEPTLVLADNIDAAIATPAINKNVFEVWVPLKQH
jgi:hypothetical protein